MSRTLTDLIATEEQLRELVPAPRTQAVWDKSIAVIDAHCRDFIAKSPFVLVATTDTTGRMDISPKGDPPGFVRVLDEKTLAIPERPGNGRADSFRNILENPRVGLYFLIPGKGETLRMSGSARLVRDQWLLDEMAMKERPAILALVVDVEEAFFHCPKCIIRSHLWEQDEWPDASGLAPLSRVVIDHARLDVPEEAVAAHLQKDVEKRLY